MIVVKVNIVKAIQNLLAISPLILLATIINIFVVEPKYGILIGVRLILVCNITYTFSKVLSPVQIAKVIEMLVYPLKIFRINPADIGLIVTIGISFLPILRDTFNQNMMALKVKGVKLKPTNIIVSLRPIFISTLKRVDEIEYALKAKGYQG